MGHLLVGDICSMIEQQTGQFVVAKEISDMFYRGILDNQRCQVLNSKRRIDEAYVPTIIETLRRRGKLTSKPKGANDGQ